MNINVPFLSRRATLLGLATLPFGAAHVLGQAAVVTREAILASAIAGADYLASTVKPDGRFKYAYRPERDEFSDDGYNIIRHATGTYILYEVARVSNESKYADVADISYGYLHRLLEPGASPDSLVLRDRVQPSIGAAGLMLMCIASRLSLKRPDVEESRKAGEKLMAFLAGQQREDGLFKHYLKRDPKLPDRKDVLFYPGEAMLGLLHFYHATGNERALIIIKRGAFALIKQQRAMKKPPSDAWFTQALVGLYDQAKQPYYLEHALALSIHMARRLQKKDTKTGEMVFRSAAPPTAAILEGIASGWGAAVRAKHQAAAPLAEACIRAAAYLLEQQLRENANFPNPKQAAGGWAMPDGKTGINEIRPDHVMHAVSALLKVRELL